MLGRLFVSFAMCALAACECRSSTLGQLQPARLVASPATLVFPATYVGHERSVTVEVTNHGGMTASVDVALAGPFLVDATHLDLGRGETATMRVVFTPTFVGPVEGVVSLGLLEILVQGEGLDVPVCVAPSVCTESGFDALQQRCVVAVSADGTSCETRCVAGGACLRGACNGHLKTCDDGDACTVDSCGEESGCSQTPRLCPAPMSSCQVSICLTSSGCGFEDVPDGTLCGADDCAAAGVDVCIAGQCVRRTRPDQGRCANTWVPVDLPARGGHTMAYDVARERVVLFGGSGSSGLVADTWEWAGISWLRRTPAASPPARTWHAMAYDGARRRIVLFGGYAPSGIFADTWEWDGTTWFQRFPLVSPSARTMPSMAYDAARQRVVLFGGQSPNGPLDDTWEWDGATWRVRASATGFPPARRHPALAYDSSRQRVVLFGGRGVGDTVLSDTWEWDGATWTERRLPVNPSLPYVSACTYDSSRSRVVVVGGAQADQFGATWELDGATWSVRTPPMSPPGSPIGAMAYDEVHHHTVYLPSVARSETWLWDGTNWALAQRPPPFRYGTALAYDAARQRTVLFGGRLNGPLGLFLADTWEWDGRAWTERVSATAPPARGLHSMAYDANRQRVVLFGGQGTQALADTWEWNGVAWVNHTPLTSPAARLDAVLAYDDARQRVVLYGGSNAWPPPASSEVWEWDGATWVQRSSSSPPARSGHAIAYDTARQRMVLFGGRDSSVSFAEVWEWDATAWLQRLTPVAPAARTLHALAYDMSRQRTVLFGGAVGQGDSNDTWEWGGTIWTQRVPQATPPPMSGHGMAYDSARQRVVVFSGADTWEFLP